MANSGLGLGGCHNGDLSGILKAAFQSVQARGIKPIVVCQYDFQICLPPQIDGFVKSQNIDFGSL
jgi:hypothetical protein